MLSSSLFFITFCHETFMYKCTVHNCKQSKPIHLQILFFVMSSVIGFSYDNNNSFTVTCMHFAK